MPSFFLLTRRNGFAITGIREGELPSDINREEKKMSQNFANLYYRVASIVSSDPNVDMLDTESIHQIDKVLENVSGEERHNLLDYMFWRFAYEMCCWRSVNKDQPHPNGELLEKFCFYKDLKRVG